MKMRKTQTDKDTERERDRDRETEKMRERETDKDRERKRDRQTDRDRETNNETDTVRLREKDSNKHPVLKSVNLDEKTTLHRGGRGGVGTNKSTHTKTEEQADTISFKNELTLSGCLSSRFSILFLLRLAMAGRTPT